jgi:hypothetical protein
MAINFSGHINHIKQDDYQTSLGYKTSERFLRIRYLFFALALCSLLVSLMQWLFPAINQTFSFLALSIVFLIIAGIFTALNAIQRNKKITLNQYLTGQLTEEGVTLWESNLENLIKWPSYSGFRTTDELLILISKDNHLVITRSLFSSSEEWRKAKNLISSYLPQIDDPKPYFFRLLPSLVIFFLVLIYMLFMIYKAYF